MSTNPRLPRGNRFSGHPMCYCSSLDESTCDFCRNTRLDPFVRLAIQWAEQANRLELEKDDPVCPDLIAIFKKEMAKTLRECSRELSEALKGEYAGEGEK